MDASSVLDIATAPRAMSAGEDLNVINMATRSQLISSNCRYNYVCRELSVRFKSC